MTEPLIASKKPCFVELEAGKAYFWCTCGRSAAQPFCDGSHQGSGFSPLKFVAERSEEAVLCACKRTGSAPFCDGSHNNLDATYEEASADEIAASAETPLTPRSGGETGIAELDGGCYVLTVDEAALEQHGSLRIAPVIGREHGAKFLSEFYAVVEQGESDIACFPGRDTVLFVMSGSGTVLVADREFDVGAEHGVYVRPGEGFRVRNPNAEPLRMIISACPLAEAPEWLAAMPETFDASIAQRVGRYDPAQREVMADRFYQVLIGAETGSREVTQFIGEIPRSRAAAHRHLYEETIMILSGEGYMWTENARAAVKAGDIIFLPRKQIHSLECTADEGMRLMGVFYPAGSPAINY